MSISKKDVYRAVTEVNECINNILQADYNGYVHRLKQLFNTIEKNEILSVMIKPYLDMNLDEENIGFIERQGMPNDFVIPTDEDEEISLIIKVLNIMKDNPDSVFSATFHLYYKTAINDNLILFNRNIIYPALKKLERKLRYKMDDIDDLEGSVIDSSKITLINIANSSNSMIALGNNIHQINKYDSDVFDKIKDVLQENISDVRFQREILELLNEMKNERNNTEEFKTKYNEFITRLGTYITIITPFLPQLVSFIGK
jgi:hypothetical protein